MITMALALAAPSASDCCNYFLLLHSSFFSISECSDFGFIRIIPPSYRQRQIGIFILNRKLSGIFILCKQSVCNKPISKEVYLIVALTLEVLRLISMYICE